MQKNVSIKLLIITGLLLISLAVFCGCGSEPDAADSFTKDTDTAATDELTGAVTDPITDTVSDTVTDDVSETAVPAVVRDPKDAYLTNTGLDKVSNGKNVIIFMIDRFDVSYYNDTVKKDPDFFDKLDGFTYFSDNISLYSRTWPAIPTMITGIDHDFQSSPGEYFSKAYTESPFLNDLKNNGYKIKLYIPQYYCYRNGTPLVGVADNISYVSEDADGGDTHLYEVDDPYVCGQISENGLSFDAEGNSYILIHLNGCHTPSNMDADAKRLKEEKKDMASALEQMRGCFKTIYFYLEEMKRLGVYDDATIVITGDHPRARDDRKMPEQPRLTALFVKPAGAKGGLKYSKAQVSQENLIPTLVKSSGIKTDFDYGRTYFEISETENTVRYHKFELSGSPNKIVVFKVAGDGNDFDNWSIDSYIEPGSGSFYK